ncbi:MAG: hypothetical protein P8163_14275 [Candidatus Thiodiazotropha sp.]
MGYLNARVFMFHSTTSEILIPSSKESRYAGDFKVKTEHPVLVVNTLFDPSTPYHML